jgi:hypothetical protein
MTLEMTKELEPSRNFFFISYFGIGSIARLDSSCEHVPDLPSRLQRQIKVSNAAVRDSFDIRLLQESSLSDVTVTDPGGDSPFKTWWSMSLRRPDIRLSSLQLLIAWSFHSFLRCCL